MEGSIQTNKKWAKIFAKMKDLFRLVKNVQKRKDLSESKALRTQLVNLTLLLSRNDYALKC